MGTCSNLLSIIKELAADAAEIDNDEIKNMVSLILAANRVFIAGAGRSGFAARAFANRLMHLGVTTFFVGEPTTPSIREGDLIIIGSGSGETASLVSMAKKAKSEGAKIGTLTIYADHSIGQLADTVIKIPGLTSKSDDASSKKESVQVPGSSFEQLSWLIYDAIVLEIKATKGLSIEQMYYRHANLE